MANSVTGLGPSVAPSNPPEPLEPLAEVERKHILYALEQCHGQRSLAAQVLRIDRKTLYRRLRSYGL